MRVLVTESKPGLANSVRYDLVAHGHHVFVCHSDGTDDFHCAGVQGHGPCPLDFGMVDVLVDVRDKDADFTAREFGVVCARRAEVPVVVVGDALPTSEGHALDSVALQCAPEEVSDAVDDVGFLPEVAMLTALRTGIRATLARRTGDARALVTLVDHGFYADVVVRSGAKPDADTRHEIEAVARSAVRPHRRDWAQTRVVFLQLSEPGDT
jgi:hypothetical protein